MNKDVEWLTVLTVEKQTKIPNATIRRYIRNHGHHLNVQKKGKSYFIASESIPIILNIRKQYNDGKSSDQVEEALSQTGNPVTITVNTDGQQMTVNIVIQSLVEHMQKQQEYIDTRLEERDRRLMTAIRENQESRKQMAAADQEKEIMPPTKDKKWYQFWK